ncbi:response regulator [Maricaulis sp. CAU 1757]
MAQKKKPAKRPARAPKPQPPVFDAAAAELEGLLMTALDAAGELVLIRGYSGCVQHVNQAFMDTFGGSRADWVGRWFSVAPPATGDNARRYEMLMRTRRGPLWIEWDERVLPGERGVIAVGRDVTQRREAHEDLEASQRAKSLFFAAVTHELRTPLAGTLGMTRLLETTELKPDQADYIRSIAASADHALTMVDDILDLSRLEAGKLDLRPESVDLAELVRETVDLAAPRAHEKGLEICLVQSAGAPIRIEGDAARIRQLLFNLIGNAVKFTSQGGIRVEIANAPDGDGQPRPALFVVDTGPGISEADQAKLFEHFERGAAEREGREAGAGLGLAMVRRLVEAMDSSMGVESRLGEGSKFWVVLDLPVHECFDATPLADQRFAVASPDPTLRAALADQLRALGGDAVEIARVDQLEASTGRTLLLDAVWSGRARRVPARQVWGLVTPNEKDDFIEDLPDGIEGWLVKPVRTASLIERLAPEAVVATEAVPGPEAAGAAPDLSGLRILVAEDDPVNALIARKCLEDLGIEVSLVADGEAALEALKAETFDAAMLDQRMPGLDGPDLARAVRKAGRGLPLIAVTANTTEADRLLCLDAGMDDFLTKPLDPARLAAALGRLCRSGKQASLGA